MAIKFPSALDVFKKEASKTDEKLGNDEKIGKHDLRKNSSVLKNCADEEIVNNTAAMWLQQTIGAKHG